MNRLAIVGHPSSGYTDVEALLKHHGMAEAVPSKREGMSVHDIQASLCKVHNAVAVEQAQQETELTQLEPSDTWRKLALDLLLGNLEQPGMWGWADPNTLPLLNMWHQVDEQTMFLLVYQHPLTALQQALASGSNATPEQLLNNWAAYHGALLAFYLRHPNRCLLVHSQQLINQPEPTFNQLPGLTEEIGQQDRFIPAANSSPLGQALKQIKIGQPEQHAMLEAAPLAIYLHQQIIENHAALAVYEELQASATQPGSITESVTALEAWKALQAQHSAHESYLSNIYQVLENHQYKLASAKADLERAKADLDNTRTELERTKNEDLNPQKNNDTLKQESPQSTTSALEEENTLLLAQLHLVQDELEKIYQRGVVANSVSKKTAGQHYGADERIKRQLTYRLGAVVVKSNSIKDFLLLPLALKREYAAYKKDLKARQGEKLPPISQYADVHKAEKVKRHLSYRLGQVIMKNGGSPVGWVRLPFSLASETKSFRRERKR